MTHQPGRTTGDRFKYGCAPKKYFENPRSPSDYGETHVVTYAPSTIKVRLRELSDEIRGLEHRNPELVARRDAILLEAEAAGWTQGEMRAACRYASVSTIRVTLGRLHALQTAEDPPTRLTG